MTTVAATLHRPLWPVSIPAPVLRGGLGELAELFVAGQHVVPDRLRALGFVFRYPTIEAALEQALGRRAAAAERVSGAP